MAEQYVKHADNCDWHADQYPWECTCGAIPHAQKDPLRLRPWAKPDVVTPTGTMLTGEEARKDTGKARFDMLPPEAMYALAELYAFGAKKYPKDDGRGWERGMSWMKCFSPLMRHAWKWRRGEKIDEESNAHHMIAVAWNALALYTYETRGVGLDDRNVNPVK